MLKLQEDPKVSVNHDWCKGCGICIEVCPTDALAKANITNKKGIYTVELANYEACTRCGLCQLGCPDFALTVHKRGKQA